MLRSLRVKKCQSIYSRFISCSSQILPSSADVVIIGGGVIGSSTAYFLSKEKPDLKVVLIEKDLCYKYCATTRSAASIRHQFSTKENIAISQYGTEFIRNLDDHLGIPGSNDKVDPQFKEYGYLFLASDAGKEILQNNIKLQKECGADIELLNCDGIKERFPWMNTEGIVYGGLGLSGEGWFDPAILMNSFRKKAQSQGVSIISGLVTKINCDSNQSKVNSVVYQDKEGKEHEITCGNCVNSSGASSARNFASMIGADIPVHPKKRCIFVFDCNDKTIQKVPLTVDPTGLYFRTEGKMFITGISPPEDNDPDVSPTDFEVDYDLFDDTIWPILANRVPSFEAIKVVNAWAGHYDHNLFDYNVILGPDTKVKNFYYANGFSGHGLQQSPAVGRALSELIIYNRFVTLDLSKFSIDRIAENQPIRELNVV